jgi:hypothetical protein
MFFAVLKLGLDYVGKVRRLTETKTLPRTVLFSLHKDSIIWELKDDTKSKFFDRDLLMPSICGGVFCLIASLYFYRANLTFLREVAIGATILSIPYYLHLLKLRNFLLLMFYLKVKAKLKIDHNPIEEISKIRENDKVIKELKKERNIKMTSATHIEQLEIYLRDHAEDMAKDWKTFREVCKTELKQCAEEINILLKPKEEKRKEEKPPPKEPPPKEPPPSNRMTRETALKVLGLSNGATVDQIQAARREAIKKFNVDHRQELEPHIRDLVEEKFKQVNVAYDYLKAAF